MEVPDIMGKQLSAAKKFLAEKDLSLQVEWEASLQTPEGEIINQVPGPGTEIKENRPLTVYASKGPEFLTVPNMEGKSITEAQNMLQRLNSEKEGVGIGLGNITRVYSEKYPEKQIMSQFPPGGQEVIAGSQINILVSRGRWPRRRVVPDLGGLSEEEARRKIKDLNLQVGELRYIRNKNASPGAVIGQSPLPNVIVPKKQPVLLTVNLGEEEQRTRQRHYTTLKINPPLSVVSGRLKVELTDRKGRRIIFDRKVKPGKNVEVFTEVNGSGRVAIFWKGKLIRYRNLEVEG
ncbi:MAG: PASTA domain-containing protein [bacterium]